MILSKEIIQKNNQDYLADHKQDYASLMNRVDLSEGLIQRLIDFQIAIPSWALGTGGTRFGRFGGGGEPRSLEEKIEDIGLLHALTRTTWITL